MGRGKHEDQCTEAILCQVFSDTAFKEKSRLGIVAPTIIPASQEAKIRRIMAQAGPR
jgi:hypothetical protein